MAKAKIASKNNPDTRGQKAREYYYNNRLVKPVLCVVAGRKIRGGAYSDNGQVVFDKAGNVLAWNDISNASTTAPTA